MQQRHFPIRARRGNISIRVHKGNLCAEIKETLINSENITGLQHGQCDTTLLELLAKRTT